MRKENILENKAKCLYDVLKEHQGATQAELAALSGYSRFVVRYNITNLVVYGIVDAEPCGNTWKYYAKDEHTVIARAKQ
jgi:predicted transcriptional regulator